MKIERYNPADVQKESQKPRVRSLTEIVYRSKRVPDTLGYKDGDDKFHEQKKEPKALDEIREGHNFYAGDLIASSGMFSLFNHLRMEGKIIDTEDIAGGKTDGGPDGQLLGTLTDTETDQRFHQVDNPIPDKPHKAQRPAKRPRITEGGFNMILSHLNKKEAKSYSDTSSASYDRKDVKTENKIDYGERFKDIEGKPIEEIIARIPKEAGGSNIIPGHTGKRGFEYYWIDQDRNRWSVYAHSHVWKDCWSARVVKSNKSGDFYMDSSGEFYVRCFTVLDRTIADKTHIEVPSPVPYVSPIDHPGHYGREK